jgi:ketosteroid isomerase-like protein
VTTVDPVRTLLATFDAFADQDFDRLTELYAEDVTWSGTEPGPWDCLSREDVFGMFRARMRSNENVVFDQILARGRHVLLAGHVDNEVRSPVVSVFTVEDGRIVRAQDYHSTDAALDALKKPRT